MRAARVKRGWSLGAAAAVLGCSIAHLSRIERGQRRAATELVAAMSDAYGVSVRTLARSARGVVLAGEEGAGE